MARFAPMKRLPSLWVCVLLLWAFVPGLGECIENVVHLVAEGHLAHAAPAGDSHAPTGPEHGCTGTFHLCSCCTSPSFVSSPRQVQEPELVSGRLDSLGRHGAFWNGPDGIDHPPRA